MKYRYYSSFLLALCLSDHSCGFVVAPALRGREARPTATSVGTLFSLFPPNDGNDNKFSNFNPFEYKNNRPNDSSTFLYSGNHISLRKTRMQEIVNELLYVVDQPGDLTKTILQNAAEFLLEPLEVDNAALDPDSIYTVGMTRAERYDAYEKSMQERLAKARNPATHKVLTALRDFVLSHRGVASSG